jgi:predicted AAA+ superfamily ATPase
VEYYQVSDNITDKKTFEREVNSLDLIDDHSKKVVLTAGYSINSAYKGIEIKDTLEWLLS